MNLRICESAFGGRLGRRAPGLRQAFARRAAKQFNRCGRPYRRGNAAFVRHCNRVATADRIAPRLFDAFSTIHFREVLMFRMQSAFPNVAPRLG
ncbi:hypothetical protein [Burkholderia ubonensis]|uniref:hypothetical protein n=1 Tax=Burkholderia ubonensis TaxID=101571 RepID=UPI0012F85918|nr:hypothetical protein [Burkholderia ubonensis]